MPAAGSRAIRASLAALFLPVFTILAAPPAASTGADLAFASNRDGDSEIYVMTSDGTGVTQVTDHPAQDANPAWSPDGRRIAFSSDRDGDFEIYVMNWDGSGVRQLTFTDSSGVDRRPAWSPDGREVLFDRPAEPSTGRHVDLYAVDIVSLAIRRLTNGIGFGSGGGDGDWSPRPTIVKHRHTDRSDWEIDVLNPATGSVTAITSNSSDDIHPSWFPDGAHIAFSSIRSGTFDVWKMTSTGGSPVRLTTDPGAELNAQVSCDGTRIAYQGNHEGNGEIYVMNADGTSQTRLTDHAASDASPSWRCLRNTPPVAVDDDVSADEDLVLDVPAPGVLANDFDTEGDSFGIELADTTTHGDLALRPDGSFTYTPDSDFHGTDSFRYRATDVFGASATARVEITVVAVNDDPTASPDEASTPQYEAVTIDVLANDTDVDGDALVIESVSAPEHGTASIEEGTVVYAPGPTFKVSDAFSYTVSDGYGGAAQATVTVTALGCGDDGLDALHGTPLDGLVSRTIDREVEPLVAAVDRDLAMALHELNCSVIVPAEAATESE